MNEEIKEKTVILPPFKHFIMTVGEIPTSYLESMTYYEMLVWFTNYLGKTVIPAINENGEAVQELQNYFIELQDYVNDYFNNLDVQEEINNKLDEMAQSGELYSLLNYQYNVVRQEFHEEIAQTTLNLEGQIDDLNSSVQTEITNQNNKIDQFMNGYTAVSSTAGMTDTSKIYINTSDGKWYYYNGSAWTAGGTYQSQGVGSNSITMDMLNSSLKFNLDERINTKDELNFLPSHSLKIDFTGNLNRHPLNSTTGQPYEHEYDYYAVTTNYIYIPYGYDITLAEFASGINQELFMYDKDFNYLGKLSYTDGFYVSSLRCTYVKFQFYLDDTTATLDYDDIIALKYNYKLYYDKTIKYETGNQLYDTNKKFTNCAITTGGKIFTSNNYNVSYPIYLETGTYSISRFRQLFIWNDVDDPVFINANTTDYTFTLTHNSYVIFSYASTYEGTIMLNKGDSVMAHESFKKYLPEDIIIPELNEDEQPENILYDKKYVALGDSFTHGDFSNSETDDYTFVNGKYSGEYKVYPFYIGNRNLMNVYNLAQNGMTLAQHNTSNYISDDVLSNIPSDVDYITIKIGINDDPSHQNSPLGTINSNDRTTFYGAWNIVMNYLLTNFPEAKIGIIVSNGIDNIDYVNATINIAKKYGVSYLNETTDDKIPLLIRTLRTDVDSTIKALRNSQWEVYPTVNSHPNAKCHFQESTIIENFLRSL